MKSVQMVDSALLDFLMMLKPSITYH